jgi:hypothetical protein
MRRDEAASKPRRPLSAQHFKALGLPKRVIGFNDLSRGWGGLDGGAIERLLFGLMGAIGQKKDGNSGNDLVTNSEK